jgi:hypothetical protein
VVKQGTETLQDFLGAPAESADQHGYVPDAAKTNSSLRLSSALSAASAVKWFWW